MSRSSTHPEHGQIGYLQLPATDLPTAVAFYAAVFGWRGDPDNAGFEAPGMIGQWVLDRPAAAGTGPVLWICVDRLAGTLDQVTACGGTVRVPPYLDGGERWLAEVDDPAGNRIGIVAMATAPQS